MQWIPRLLVLGTLLAGVWGLAACAEDPAPGVLESRHCMAVLNFLNRDLGETTAEQPKIWEGDGTRNISIPYKVAVVNERALSPTVQRDVILCRYALEPRNKSLVVELVAIRQRGVDLSAEQMRVVNIAMRVFR
ncbi:hypothetical protein JCM17960_28080 [Magnetospira thiophila]